MVGIQITVYLVNAADYDEVMMTKWLTNINSKCLTSYTLGEIANEKSLKDAGYSSLTLGIILAIFIQGKGPKRFEKSKGKCAKICGSLNPKFTKPKTRACPSFIGRFLVLCFLLTPALLVALLVDSGNIWVDLFFGKSLGCFLLILTFPYDILCVKMALLETSDGQVAVADATANDGSSQQVEMPGEQEMSEVKKNELV